MRLRPASSLALAALSAGVSSGCLSYSSDTPPIDVPAALGTAAPRVRVEYDDNAANLRESFERELAQSGAFVVGAADGEDVNVILSLRRTTTNEDSGGMFLLSALTLFLLPVPTATATIGVLATLEAPPLEPVQVDFVGPTVHYWTGILVLPFSFIHADEDELFQGVSADLSRSVQKGYADYHADAWEATRGSSAPGDYAAFLAAFPTSIHAAKVSSTLEDALWKNVRERGSSQDYLRYLENFPDGRHAAEARAAGSDRIWKEVSTTPDEELLEAFLATFSADPRQGQAVELLDDLLWERATDPGDKGALYRAYVRRFPDGKRIERALDAVAWADAEGQGTPAGVQAYLTAWPEGAYAAHAREVLGTLSSGRPGASAVIQELVAATLRKASAPPTLAQIGPSEAPGSVTANPAGVPLTVAYYDLYENGRWVGRRIRGGSADFEGTTYIHGTDGEWYPAFEHLFRD